MSKTNNELIRQFDNHFIIKRIEMGWYELAGFWIIQMESHGWRLHNADKKKPLFLTKGTFYKSDAIAKVRLVYIMIWREVEVIESEKK